MVNPHARKGEKVKKDMKNLKLINSEDNLIKAYPDQFEGIGKFPCTYHIYLKEDVIPACAQDIFQRTMDQIIDHCGGVIGIAHDIIIHGKDDAEHDRRIHKFIKVTRVHGLVLYVTMLSSTVCLYSAIL